MKNLDGTYFFEFQIQTDHYVYFTMNESVDHLELFLMYTGGRNARIIVLKMKGKE